MARVSSTRAMALVAALAALSVLVAGCGASALSAGDQTGYTVTRCGGGGAPTSAQPAIYATTVGGNSIAAHLYDFAPESGAIRWCVSFAPRASFTCSGARSCPPPVLALAGQPLAADGALYLCVSGYSGYTYALNAVDGAVRWARQTDCAVNSIPFADEATPLLAGGTLFSGPAALDPHTGALRWRLPDDLAPGAAANGTLYAYSQSAVSAWDATSGKQRWSYTLPDPLGGPPVVAHGAVYVDDIGGNSPPAMTPDQLDTFALDAATGKLLWRAPTGVATGAPLTVGNAVYVGGFGPALSALDADSGHVRWRRNTAPLGPSTPTYAAGMLYFSADGVYALDAASGALRWRQPLGASQSTSLTPPALGRGAIYVGEMDGSGVGTLYALSMSGAVLWSHGGLSQLSQPVVVE